MTATAFIIAVITFIVGVVLGALYHRKWKGLYHDALGKLASEKSQHALTATQLETEKSAAKDARHRAEVANTQLDAANANIETLTPLAELGKRTQMARDNQNEKRRKARAEAPKKGRKPAAKKSA